jgi:4-hydroxybenzoate polyprenyltransferase
MNFKIFYFFFLIVPLIQLIKNQIIDLKITNTLNCLKKFKSNNLLGFLILVNILIGKLI